MMRLAAAAALVAAATASPIAAAPKEKSAGAAESAFPESRLITPAQGVLLNRWAEQPAEQPWKLCYTTFSMDKTPAAFHKGCDQYKPTVTVVHNAGGRPGRCQGEWEYQDGESGSQSCSPIGATCKDRANPGGGPACPDGGHGSGKCEGVCASDCIMRPGNGCQVDEKCSVLGSPCGPYAPSPYGPTNPGNFTFGGYAGATWGGGVQFKGPPAGFIFGLGPQEPEHFELHGQWVGPGFFPAWGGVTPIFGLPNADGLWIGGTSMHDPTGDHGEGFPPGIPDGGCSHGLCGGNGNWGETELEVWRPVCYTDANCGAHQSCDANDGLCSCESGWSGLDCGTCDKKHFCSGRGSCVLPSSGNTPPCHCNTGYSGADCSTFAGSPLFPGTKIVSPEWGTALDNMTQQSGVQAGQVWKLCYSSDTMNKTTTEFHKRCDQYNKTLTVGHNSLGPGTSGTIGRPDSLIGRTFGGFVRSCMPLSALLFSCPPCPSRSDLPRAP